MDKKPWTSLLMQRTFEKIEKKIEHQITLYEQNNKISTTLLNQIDNILLKSLNCANAEIEKVFEKDLKQDKTLVKKDSAITDQFHLLTLHQESTYLLINFTQKDVSLLKKFALSSENTGELNIILEDFFFHKIRKQQITLDINLRSMFFLQPRNTVFDWNNALAVPYYGASNIFNLILIPLKEKKSSIIVLILKDNQLNHNDIYDFNDLGRIDKLCFLNNIHPQEQNKYQWGVSFLIFAEHGKKIIEFYLLPHHDKTAEKKGNKLDDENIFDPIFLTVSNTNDEHFIVGAKKRRLFLFERQSIKLLQNNIMNPVYAQFYLHSKERLEKIIHCEKKYIAILSSKDETYLKFVLFDINVVYDSAKIDITNGKYFLMSTRPLTLLLLMPYNDCVLCFEKHHCYMVQKIFVNMIESDKVSIEEINTKLVVQIRIDQFYSKQIELKWFTLLNSFTAYNDFNMLKVVLKKKEIYQDEIEGNEIVHSKDLERKDKKIRVMNNEEEIFGKHSRKQIKL